MAKNYRALTAAAGVVLILVATITYLGLAFNSSDLVPWQGSAPPVWAPMAGLIFVLTFIAAAILGGLSNFGPYFITALLFLVPLSIGSLFWITGRPLFRGEANVPRWLLWATLVIGILNVAYFISSWEYALKFQGFAHTTTVIVENVVLFGAIVLVYRSARRKPSFNRNLWCRWLFFFWINWCAFPVLGEIL
ncbi:MAG: hypothetical protein ACI8S3_001892 [Alphaproteobacteria bacterium]|jgi:hypothetical protein